MKKRAGITTGIFLTGLVLAVSIPVHGWATSTAGIAQPTQLASQAGQTTVTPAVSEEQSGLQQRLEQLELAVRPQSAEEAVQLFFRSHQWRSGGLLYAILSPEERERSRQRLAEQHWVLGVSSPYVKHYRVAGAVEENPDTIHYQLHFLHYTSTGFMGIENIEITVKKIGNYWLVDKYTPVTFGGEMDLFGEKLTEQTALGLVAEAQQRYWYVASGGDANQYHRFQPAEMETMYRYLSDDIGNREKLTAYFAEIFDSQTTEQFIAQQIEQKLLLEVDGRLAQPDADGGSLLQWGKAKLLKLNQTGEKASATFQVPLGEDAVETYTIPFTYEKNVGWRIAHSPQQLH